MTEIPVADIAVIGGGIAGAGIARDAALRGLSVVLFEKNTFGSGTSSKSSKLIHGGIRYLETAWVALKSGRPQEAWKNLRFVFHSLKESRTLERIAPDLVTPLPLVVPIYKGKGRGRLTVYAGSLLYFVLAFLSGGARFPRFFRSKKTLLAVLPALNPDGLTGGVMIWDHLTDDRRLVRKTIESAQKSGAAAFEDARVTGYKKNDKGLFEIEVERAGKTEKFLARHLINASGPWVDSIRALAAGAHGRAPLLQPIAGSHLTFKRFLPISAILEAADERVFFAINIGETTRVGTTERTFADPDRIEATEEETDYLLNALKKYFPTLGLDKKAVLSRDAGIRPLARPKSVSGSPSRISREHELVIDEQGAWHVLGVKLTDHRRAAEEIVDKLKPGRKCRTDKILL